MAESSGESICRENKMSTLSHHPTSAASLSSLGVRLADPASRALPPVWRPLVRWFTAYSRRYIGKQFHSFSVSRSSAPPYTAPMPIVLYANHAGWWDPLVGIILKEAFFPNYTLFAPIDAVALRRYKILTKIGFFGVERQSVRGVADYIGTAETILQDPEHLLAVTPHGRFTDARERPVQFQRGLGLLATRVERALFLPVAIEYAFWDERRPEIFCRFGEPTEVSADGSEGLTAWHWTAAFEQRLEATQDALANEVCQRDPDKFENLFRSKT
jgi:1-acyl-sn-glycerol-3-phosphate acyltransferase